MVVEEMVDEEEMVVVEEETVVEEMAVAVVEAEGCGREKKVLLGK